MKRNLFFLLPLLLILAEACTPKTEVTPVLFPQGTFTGEFGSLIKNKTGTGYDTIRDSIVLKLSTPANFAVLADTTVKHAGSKGSFAYNGYYIQFNDSTKYTSGAGSKFHLRGTYQYLYDGSNLQMLRNSTGDTVTIQYILKKSF